MNQINRPVKTALTMAIALALSNGAVQAQEKNKLDEKEAKSERQIESIVITSTPLREPTSCANRGTGDKW